MLLSLQIGASELLGRVNISTMYEVSKAGLDTSFHSWIPTNCAVQSVNSLVVPRLYRIFFHLLWLEHRVEGEQRTCPCGLSLMIQPPSSPRLSFRRSYLLQSSRWNNTFVRNKRGTCRARFFINVDMMLPPSVVYLFTYLFYLKLHTTLIRQ